MVTDNKNFPMAIPLKESIKTIDLMDSELTTGRMEMLLTKEVSKTDYGMEKGNGLQERLNTQVALSKD
jgi:hypothetical protein